MMDYDGVIVGGGIVGATLALALAQLGMRVLLLERQMPTFTDEVDERTLALSYASAYIYSQLGIWENLEFVPIQKVKVCVQGKPNLSCLRAEKLNLPALGYMVSANQLTQIIYQQLAAWKVEVICAQIEEQQSYPEQWRLKVASDQEKRWLNSKLLIAADGGDSQLRKKQGILCHSKDYHHCAIMANVQLDEEPYCAWEQFLVNGAIALLPWKDGYFTCVWTTHTALADLQNLNDEAFREVCQKQLGERFGKIKKVGKRWCYPLVMQIAKVQHGARFLLMGNAAHQLHPIAAQGLNLSLRDIWQLTNQVKKNYPCDMGTSTFLEAYMNQRMIDQQRVIFATDKIATFLASDRLAMNVRALGLTLFDVLFKQPFTHYGVGLCR